MPLENVRFPDHPAIPARATAQFSDAAVIVFTHALKVWARERGVAEQDLPGLAEVVAEFADAAIRDYMR
ncbi:MAG: hypothetical protein KKC14_17795 [Alphaproteobacteria bacterium]|nr:hypothetical protein [Alphaproteobacteria bacterium]